MTDFKELEIRSYVSEPHRGRRAWEEKAAEQQAVTPIAGAPEEPAASG